MLPSSASRISSSLAFGLSFSSCTADITIPGVQKPHCSPWHSRKAACIGCSSPLLASPSIVVTSLPCTCAARIEHDLIARPFMCTVQAPHCAVSQPTWVPVSCSCSRRYCTSRVRESTVLLGGAAPGGGGGWRVRGSVGEGRGPGVAVFGAGCAVGGEERGNPPAVPWGQARPQDG